jgi:hypothetical protein
LAGGGGRLEAATALGGGGRCSGLEGGGGRLAAAGGGLAAAVLPTAVTGAGTLATNCPGMLPGGSYLRRARAGGVPLALRPGRLCQVARKGAAACRRLPPPPPKPPPPYLHTT